MLKRITSDRPRRTAGIAALCLLMWSFPAVSQPLHYGSTINEQRNLFLQAREAQAQSRTREYQTLRNQLNDYPLTQYLDYTDISQRLVRLPMDDVEQFLTRHAGSYLGLRLRREWLTVLAAQSRWQDYLRFYSPDVSQTVLQCHYHRARIETGSREELSSAGELWNVARSQPNECDPVFSAWMADGHLTPEIAWDRFSKNMQAANRSLARYLATLMPPREQRLAELYLRIDGQPERLRTEQALESTDPEIRDIILHGVRRLANIDAPQAMLMLNLHHERQRFPAEEMTEALRYVATRLLTQGFEDETESLLRSTPGLATEILLNGLLRDALREQNWRRVNELLTYLPAEVRASERWQYWDARARQAMDPGQGNADAESIYRTLAQNRSFYGFLAADRLGMPYVITDIPLQVSREQIDALYNAPAIVRAHELYHIGDEINARNEWQHAAAAMTTQQIAASALLASNWGWHRNAIQATIRIQDRDDLAMRFPLAYGDTFSSAAAQLSVPTHLLYAITRQESAFMHDVRSSAGALGLMQLMPATAREVARGVGLRITERDLLIPDINISLGSHYLARVLQEFDGNRILAAAAYNAGPNRVRQWLRRTQDSPVPVDVWIETIPFAETRGYVQNVLVYSVIYAHRMGQSTPFMSAAEQSSLL
jgi:soluble lytic murein transglycosylase